MDLPGTIRLERRTPIRRVFNTKLTPVQSEPSKRFRASQRLVRADIAHERCPHPHKRAESEFGAPFRLDRSGLKGPVTHE